MSRKPYPIEVVDFPFSSLHENSSETSHADRLAYFLYPTLCCSQHPPETKWILSLYYVMSNGYFYVTLEHLNFQRKIFEPNAPGLSCPQTSTKKTLVNLVVFLLAELHPSGARRRRKILRFSDSPVQCDHLMCAIPARPGLRESNQQVPPILIFGPSG